MSVTERVEAVDGLALWQRLVNDSRLPGLSDALDEAALIPAFARVLAPFLKPFEAEVCGVSVERIQLRPGKRCRMLYEVVFSRPVAGRSTWWFSGKLLRPKVAARHFAGLAHLNDSASGWAPAVFYLDGLKMILWRFPYEEAMPGLQCFERKEVFEDFLRTHLLPLLPRPGTWVWQGYRPMKYMPGKRCVLLHTFLNTENEESVHLFSKTYPDALARTYFRRWQQMARRINGRLAAPRPLCYWEAAHTGWMALLPGKPLLHWPNHLNQAMFIRLGVRIAQLHCLPFNGMTTPIALADVRQSAREDCDCLSWYLPHHSALFERLSRQLERLFEHIEIQDIPRALVHNALRLEQFLYDGNRLALLDFDAAGAGDPLYDVAEWLASLEYLALRRPEFRPLLRWKQSFLEAYARSVPWAVEEERLLAYRLTALVGKLHDSLKNMDRPALIRLADIIDLLEDGLARAAALCGA